MKKAMPGFAVGAKCPILLPEGPVLKFSQAGITMFVSIPKPDRYEKKAFKAGHPVKFAVTTVDRMGFLVADFGENFVMDVPFDVGLEQDYDIPELALTSPDSKVLLTLVAVDSKTKMVFGLRCISLSPSVSAAFANIVEMQRSSKIAMAEHEANIRRAYAAHSSPEALMGHVGTKEMMNSTTWPTNWGIPEVLPCAAEMLERNDVTLDTYLQRILAGDYGLSDRGNGHINQLRTTGQRFTSTFEMPDKTLLYISVNEFGRTIVCDWFNH